MENHTTNDGDDPIVTIKHTTDGGSDLSTIHINSCHKDETINITPTNFKQNQYGATIAQVAPANSYFSSTPVYFEAKFFRDIGE